MDNKRAGLRQFYSDQANQQARTDQHTQSMAKSDALESTVVNAFNALIKYLEGHTSKTEVVNQLRSISTPDVDNVVKALSKLDTDILHNKLDLKPLLDAMNGIKREVSLIPKSHAKTEAQLDTIKVSNLSDVTPVDLSPLLKAIKQLKLNPVIDVKTPVVNVEKTDLKPLQDIMLNVVKAIQTQDYPETPVTDLKTLEKNAKDANAKLDQANKHLKKLVEKPVGGSSGGSSSPFISADGKTTYITLNPDGSQPTIGDSGFLTSSNITTAIITAGTVITTTKTDGVRTLTKTVDTTDPNSITMTEVWT